MTNSLSLKTIGQATTQMPFFVTDFEDAWPIDVYMSRYLCWRSIHQKTNIAFKKAYQGSPIDWNPSNKRSTDKPLTSSIDHQADSSGSPIDSNPSKKGCTSNTLTSRVDHQTDNSESTEQSFVPRPKNEHKLKHCHSTSQAALRMAMKLDETEFNMLKVFLSFNIQSFLSEFFEQSLLQQLAIKTLDIDKPLDAQSREKWQSFITKVRPSKPVDIENL